MIYPNADKLENWGSKYSLVILAAKRAKQLKQGAKPLIRTDSANALTIALEEIAAEAISCSVPDNDLPLVAQEEQEASQLLAPTEPRVDLEREDTDVEPGETVLVGDDEEDAASASDDEEHDEDVGLDEDDDLTLVDGEDEEEDEDEEEADHDEDADSAVTLLAEELQPKPRKRGRKAASVDESPVPDVLESDAVFEEPIEELDEDTED